MHESIMYVNVNHHVGVLDIEDIESVQACQLNYHHRTVTHEDIKVTWKCHIAKDGRNTRVSMHADLNQPVYRMYGARET